MCVVQKQVPEPHRLPQKRSRAGGYRGGIQTWPACVYLGGNKDGATALGKAVIPQGTAPKPRRCCPSLPALRCLPCLALLLCLFTSEEGGEGSWGGAAKAGRSREGGEPI